MTVESEIDNQNNEDKAVVHGLRKPCENEHAMLLLKTLIEQNPNRLTIS